MKSITLSFCLFLLIFVSCKSKEEKAAELIKGELYKTLYDFASYEPIETKVDSAFTSIYRDSVILAYGYLSRELLDKANEYIDKTKDAQSTMEIWGDSYSSYSISKYNSARQEFNSNLELAKEYMARIKMAEDSIKLKAKGFRKTFCGWQAKHKFRCKTKGGNFDLPNYVFFIDPKFKKIYYSEDIADEKLIKVRSLLDEILETKSSSN